MVTENRSTPSAPRRAKASDRRVKPEMSANRLAAGKRDAKG